MISPQGHHASVAHGPLPRCQRWRRIKSVTGKWVSTPCNSDTVAARQVDKGWVDYECGACGHKWTVNVKYIPAGSYIPAYEGV